TSFAIDSVRSWEPYPFGNETRNLEESESAWWTDEPAASARVACLCPISRLQKSVKVFPAWCNKTLAKIPPNHEDVYRLVQPQPSQHLAETSPDTSQPKSGRVSADMLPQRPAIPGPERVRRVLCRAPWPPTG